MIVFKNINYSTKYRILPAVYFLVSWAIVGFGQPAWNSVLGVLSSVLGFALFWKGLSSFSSQKYRFWTALVWFMAVESVHLSWMTSTEFQGNYIYFVYFSMLFLLGLQFGALSYFVKNGRELSWSRIGFLVGFWVVMEWSRLFFICGFPFNPVGLSLSSTILGIQNASIAGVYGLSFWVMLTNLVGYKWISNLLDQKVLFIYIVLIVSPYLYGGLHYSFHHKKMQLKEGASIKSLLVQTGLNPTEKTGFRGFHRMLPPIDQWGMIYEYLASHQRFDIDIIGLPERSVPLSHNTPFYPAKDVHSMAAYYFGQKGVDFMPKLSEGQEYVDNMYLSQTLANIFQAQVVVGLEYVEKKGQRDFLANASAYCFSPDYPPQIYNKRVLLPLVEYIPFNWCKKLAKRYNIEGWYEPGKKAVVFNGALKISPSICMEEMYSYVVRGGRLSGCNLFLNITNDAWYPNSKLPKQHYDHGVIRALENGVPVLRSCNTGVTAAVNSLGDVAGVFQSKRDALEWSRGALFSEVSNYHYTTLYSLVGDGLVLSLSFALILNLILRSFRIKLLTLNPVRETKITQ